MPAGIKMKPFWKTRSEDGSAQYAARFARRILRGDPRRNVSYGSALEKPDAVR